MRHLPAATKFYCAICFGLVLLIALSLSTQRVGRWHLLATDPVSDGLAISALVFSDAHRGWASRPANC